MSCLVHRIDDGKDTTDETLQILNNIGSQNSSVHTYAARAPKGESQCHLQILSFHKVSSTRSKRKRSSTNLPICSRAILVRARVHTRWCLSMKWSMVAGVALMKR